MVISGRSGTTAAFPIHRLTEKLEPIVVNYYLQCMLLQVFFLRQVCFCSKVYQISGDFTR